jgi:molybdopterin-biosynthesis enzyme MoeA-like protein
MSDSRLRIGALIIGDEIILGTREDKHFAQLQRILRARGLRLDWAMYLGDDRARLTDTLCRTLANDEVVFSFGGIGNTPDDHTRQSAAAAAGRDLELHPAAEASLRQRYAEAGREVSDWALDMARFPQGSRVIPNPFNRIAGFSYARHHFVPGFPQMAWPMVEWVLDNEYAEHFHLAPQGDDAIRVWQGIESVLTPLMLRIESEFTGLKVFSLPFLGSADVERHVELGVRGEPAQIAAAMEVMKCEVERLGYRWSGREAS